MVTARTGRATRCGALGGGGDLAVSLSLPPLLPLPCPPAPLEPVAAPTDMILPPTRTMRRPFDVSVAAMLQLPLRPS